MFTGIIEDVGEVEKCGSFRITILTKLAGIGQGESVAVNGICLTVTKVGASKKGTAIEFDFSPETEARTNIASLSKGSPVNLERALRVGDRFGGHIMTGHIEGVGKIVQKKRKDDSWMFTFSVSDSLSKYIASKGSVGVDGISLTVVDSDEGRFSASVIPFTMSHTNLGSRKTGESVNIEPDVLAKYVEHLLFHKESKSITSDFLREYGFLQ